MIPETLSIAIDKELSSHNTAALKRAREDLTHRYRQGLSPRMETKEERLSYLATRMPATFAVLEKVMSQINYEGKTVLDLGAGPGTAYWAMPGVRKITHLEHDRELIKIAERLAGINSVSEWVAGDFTTSIFKAHDIALFSYSFNEAVQLAVIEKAWAVCETLVIVEPGTKQGYKNILLARDHLKTLGAYMVAPCPHYNPCPLKEGDWCHFAVRVARSGWHKDLKGGTMGYEDEKYSYLIVSKTPSKELKSRIITPPEKHSGHMILNLCTQEGIFKKTLSKKDGELYKAAKKLDWGDSI